MGIYDYMNHFWFENENDPCSLSESVLYFYLLYEANRQHWVTPFKVSTQMLVARLNTSKQNVMKAREGLRKRRLIGFSKGEGKGKPALYTLTLTNIGEGVSQTLPLSQTMTPELTDLLPPKLSQTLPHSNNKEENNKEEVKEEKDNKGLTNYIVMGIELAVIIALALFIILRMRRPNASSKEKKKTESHAEEFLNSFDMSEITDTKK